MNNFNTNKGKDAYIWAEKYRPNMLDDVIIPDDLKKQFRAFIADKQIPNLLLTSSTPGTGKTTTAYALCNELGIKPLFLNASLNNSIDDIRVDVMQYATTMSLYGGDSHKVVIFDEADRLSANAMDALKGIIEEVHKNCRFILTANNKNKIIEPLQSRLTNIDFRFNKGDSDKMMAKMFKRAISILEENNIEYDKAAVAGIVKYYAPDNRRLLTFLQQEAKNGKIDEGSLAKAASASPETLIESIKGKKYKEVQIFILDNVDKMTDDFYQRIFVMMEPRIAEHSVPQLVLILAEYQKYDSIVPSKYIHYLAMCTEIMMQVNFKG